MPGAANTPERFLLLGAPRVQSVHAVHGWRRFAVGVAFAATLLAASRADALYTAELVFDREPAATSYNVYARFEKGVGPTPTEPERKIQFLASALPAGADERIRVLVRDLPVGPLVTFAVTAVRNGSESLRSNKLRLSYASIAYYIDSDGDGLLDFEEDFDLDLVVDAGETDSRKADTDGDGLNDYREVFETYTDPLKADSDNDGTVDGRDTCNDMDRDGYGSAVGSTSSCRWDNCPSTYNPGQTDSDYDSMGEACDPCTNVGGFQDFDPRGVAVTFGRVYGDGVVGNDTLAVRGEFSLPPATSFGSLDPSIDGARIVLEAVNGVVLADIKLPAGLKQAGEVTGWKVDSRNKKIRYVDQSSNRVGGIVKLMAKDMSRRSPRLVRLVVKGKDGIYPVAPELAPIRVVVVLGNSDASKQGACGETAFAADACTLKNRRSMACR